MPNEVVIELPNSVSAQQIESLQRGTADAPRKPGVPAFGHHVVPLGYYGQRSVATVVRELEADRLVAWAQPNYLFMLQQNGARIEGDAAQYGLAKLRCRRRMPSPRATTSLSRSSIPQLTVTIRARRLDRRHVRCPFGTGDPAPARNGDRQPDRAHGRLMGRRRMQKSSRCAPSIRKTPARKAPRSTFSSPLDWAAAQGARVINMSFAGPDDPAIHRSLEAARKKGIVLVAAAGNAGAKSPPLYPAADPNVIAVSATDADDNLFEQSNRGRYITVAARARRSLSQSPTTATRCHPAHLIPRPR